MTLCAAALAPAAGSVAQPLLFVNAEGYQFTSNQYPTCTAVADFDDDGQPDLIVTGRNAKGQTALLRGLSGGGFALMAPLLPGFQTDWVIARDLDRDGNLDLAIAVRSVPSGVSILRGGGNGTFEQTQHEPTGRGTTMITAQDLDHDGDLDLIAGNYQSDTLTVLHNDGLGGFTIEQDVLLSLGLPYPSRPLYFTAADLDEDGMTDVVVSNIGIPHLSFLDGVPGGRLAPPLIVPVNTPVCILARDIERDGDLDLLMTDLTGFQGAVVVLPNTGSGTFGPPLSFPLGNWSWYIDAADFDGDGYDDVIVTEAISGDLRLLRNRGDGTIGFAAPLTISGGQFPRHVACVDVDADCDLDLVLTDIAAHRMRILHNITPQLGDCTWADLNDDGRINVTDLLAVLAAWGTDAPLADFNLDGEVDVNDLLFLLSVWT
jgi:hypothetical protein